MPTDITMKPKRQTWLDLLPDGAPRPALEEMLSREELIAELAERGVEVTPVTIAYWERTNVLPRAIRRYRGGRAHAFYPWFAVNAIAQVRDMQAIGRSLDDISGYIRAWVLDFILWQDPMAQSLAEAREAINPVMYAYRAYGKPAVRARLTLLDEHGQEIGGHEFSLPAE